MFHIKLVKKIFLILKANFSTVLSKKTGKKFFVKYYFLQKKIGKIKKNISS